MSRKKSRSNPRSWTFAQDTEIFDLLKRGKTVAEVAEQMKKKPFLIEQLIRWSLLIKLCDELCPFFFSDRKPWTSTEENSLVEMARSAEKPSIIAEKLGRGTWEVELQFARIRLADFGPNDRGIQYRVLPDVQFDPRSYHKLYQRLLEQSISFIKPRTAPAQARTPEQDANVSLDWSSFVMVMSWPGNFDHKMMAGKFNTDICSMTKRLQNLQDAIPSIWDLRSAHDHENKNDYESTDRKEKNVLLSTANENRSTLEMMVSCKRQCEEDAYLSNGAKRQKADHEGMGEPCFSCGKHGHRREDCVAPRTCHVCQEPGHSWLRCPVAARDRKEWRKELGIDLA